VPTKKQKSESEISDDTKNIEPGMIVEATRGDLGEEDVSKSNCSDSS
jgi:hypothetical protein